MDQRTKKIRFCGWMLAVNILFIWGNSMLPGSVSGAMSLWLRNLLSNFVSGGSETVAGGDGLLRKLAHITEFAGLGALLIWLLWLIQKPRIWTLPAGVFVACVDEAIQCFAPNRGPAVRDVLIDTAGLLLGIAILSFGKAIIKRK